MSDKKTDDGQSEDSISDDGDVTEIISAPTTPPVEENPDVTQILPMRSTSESSQVPDLAQQLPGTIIGRVGTKQADTAPELGGDANEDEATRILFSSEPADAHDVAVAEEVTPQPADDTEPDAPPNSDNTGTTASDADQSRSVDTPSSAAGNETPTNQEKTVFLAPVSKTKTQDDFNPPVGWLIVVAGPGRGAVLDIHYGQNTLGRGNDHHIQLNFGDTQISRETHAFVIYDELERTFFLRDAGQKNLVRINNMPVMAPTQLSSHDQIQIGQTTCLFVPLCTDAFDWLGGEDDPETGPPEEGKS